MKFQTQSKPVSKNVGYNYLTGKSAELRFPGNLLGAQTPSPVPQPHQIQDEKTSNKFIWSRREGQKGLPFFLRSTKFPGPIDETPNCHVTISNPTFSIRPRHLPSSSSLFILPHTLRIISLSVFSPSHPLFHLLTHTTPETQSENLSVFPRFPEQ